MPRKLIAVFVMLLSAALILSSQLSIAHSEEEIINSIEPEADSKPRPAPVPSPVPRPVLVPEPEPVIEFKQIKSEEVRRMCAGASYEIIKNAIENRKADVNAGDYYDVTPIMLAAEKNFDPEIINLLIESGADVNAHDKDSKTALMYAAISNGSPEIIKALASGAAKSTHATTTG